MRIFAVVTIIISASILTRAQDVRVLRRIAEVQLQKSESSIPRGANFFRAEETSELRLVLSSVVRAYQLLISSQDTDVCAYEPSCSRFGMFSMQRYGVLRGFLLTADRLNRCSGLTDSQHERNLETGKFLDPVDAYDTYFHKHR